MTHAMFVDGRAVQTMRTTSVLNPATGSAFAEAPVCSRDQLDSAFAAALRAQPGWAADEQTRRAALLEAADALRGTSAELAPLLVAEQGKPLAQAVREVEAAAQWLAYYADVDLPRSVIQDDDRAFVVAVSRPVGVVAAITPWNFPLLLACWKLGPALAAGNAVVLKPSPFTPLATLRMAALLGAVMPSGVLNAVSGTEELGEWMTAHPTPRKVSFTGSIATGKRIAGSTASDLKRLTLELGGNDPAIVLDDADPATVADGIFDSAFLNAGQVCCAVKRVYVPRRLEQVVLERLAARASALRVGDGMDRSSQMGPLNNRAQLDRVRMLTEQAVVDGARVVAGGHDLDRPGYFYAPTILADAHDGMAVVDDEQFGPVLPVVGYDSLNSVVDRVNASQYGLSASVWGEDETRAEGVAGSIACGTVWINAHAVNAPHQPFAGVKWSGIGVENGIPGLRAYTETQVIHRKRNPASTGHVGRPTDRGGVF